MSLSSSAEQLQPRTEKSFKIVSNLQANVIFSCVTASFRSDLFATIRNR